MRAVEQAQYDTEKKTAEEDENPTKLQLENELRTRTSGRVGPPLPSDEVSSGDSESDKSRDEKLPKDLSEARTDPKRVMDMKNQADHGSGSGRGHPQQTRILRDMALLSKEDRDEVTDLVTKMFNGASVQEKASTLVELQPQVSPAELAEATNQRTELLMWHYVDQAIHIFKAMSHQQ
ncbi:hypothetical protein SNK03_003920 [Fusarium graminearum]